MTRLRGGCALWPACEPSWHLERFLSRTQRLGERVVTVFTVVMRGLEGLARAARRPSRFAPIQGQHRLTDLFAAPIAPKGDEMAIEGQQEKG